MNSDIMPKNFQLEYVRLMCFRIMFVSHIHPANGHNIFRE